MYRDNAPEEKPTTQLFIGYIMMRESCSRHNAEEDDPCWTLELSNGFSSVAICNTRAERALRKIRKTAYQPTSTNKRRHRDRHLQKTGTA